MSTNATKRMLAAYRQFSTAKTRFLSGFFKSPPQNFYNSEEVEIDIERGEEDIAICVTDLSKGYNSNAMDLYTNKSFKAPVFKESAPINALSLIKRLVGDNPFKDPDFQANAVQQAFRIMREMEGKISRAIELQASQVLTTGIVTLPDALGNAKFTVDYKPKATHFPTAGTAWDDPAGDPRGDIIALSNVIRDDGLADPNLLIFGEAAFEVFILNSDIQALFDNRRIATGGELGGSVMNGVGGQFRGTINIGNYQYEVWTYGGRYNVPGGVKTQYMPTDKVIVMSDDIRLDATFGNIPRIGAMDSRVLPFLPNRVSNVAGGRDMVVNAWLEPDGTQLNVGVGARPLMIPTAIDQFGCLTTGI